MSTTPSVHEQIRAHIEEINRLRGENTALRKMGSEAVEAARFLDGIRRRSMGTSAVADRLIDALRAAGFEP